MTQFTLAATSQIRNVLLCTLATLTLAACGGESGSSSAAATADTDTTSAAGETNVGMIDRSAGIDANDGTSAAATVVSNTISNTVTTTVTSGSSASGMSSSGSGTTPVRTINGVAILDWMPPTENSDGSALTNLAGYTVYYGTSPNDLSQSVKVSNPGLTAYSVTGLASGTWYFALTSYSADGVESTRTSTVTTTI